MNLAQLFNPIEKIVGMEITDGHIRAVLLEKNKKGVLSVAKKSAVLPAGSARDGRVIDKEKFAEAVKKFVQSNKSIFKSRYVVLTLPPMYVFTDIMKFPPVAKEQIAESIALNINTKTIFPMNADEIYYDWEPVKSKDLYHQEILLGLAMKDYIKNWTEACEAAGLEPLAFEAPAMSVARALDNFRSKTGAILRITREGAEIAIVSEGELRFSRFTRMPKIGTFEEFKEFLLNELSLALNFYSMENPRAESARTLALVSELEQEKEVGDFLASGLELAVQKAHPADLPEIEPSYIAAYGAARRGLIAREKDTLVSLMPIGTEETYRKRRFLAYISLWSDIINATAVILAILFVGIWFFLQRVEKRIDTQITASQAASAIGEQIAALENDALRFNELAGRLAAAEDSIHRWSPLLGKLPAALAAPDITVKTIGLPDPKGDITVNLTAATRASAVSFRKMLGQSGEYESVTMPFLDVSQRENININVILKPKIQ